MKKPDSIRLLHEVEQNEKVVAHLGVDPIDSMLVLPISNNDEEFALNLLERELEIKSGSNLLAIQISDRWFWKDCRAEGISRLIMALEEEFSNMEILCFSYPGIDELVDRIFKLTCKAMGVKGSVNRKIISPNKEIELRDIEDSRIHFISNLPLKKYAATLKKCEFLVTMHSGATHISAAVALPSIVVFNPDYFEYYSYRERPWKVEHRAVRKAYCENSIESMARKEIDGAIKGHIEDIIASCRNLELAI